MMRNVQGSSCFGLRGLGRHQRQRPDAGRRRCAACATRTSTGGNARPASPTCRAAGHQLRLPQWRQGQSMLIVDWKRSGRAGLSPHPRTGGRATERDRPGAALRCTARSRRTSIRKPAGTLARGATAGRHHRQPHLPRLGRRRRRRAADPRPQEDCCRRRTAHGQPATPTTRRNAELEAAQASILYMSPDQGGHTSLPVFGMTPKS